MNTLANQIAKTTIRDQVPQLPVEGEVLRFATYTQWKSYEVFFSNPSPALIEILSKVRELHVEDPSTPTSQQDAHRVFIECAPHLPSLKRVTIVNFSWVSQQAQFSGSQGLDEDLKKLCGQYQSVTSLKLVKCTLESVYHLHKLVWELPKLTDLHLDRVKFYTTTRLWGNLPVPTNELKLSSLVLKNDETTGTDKAMDNMACWIITCAENTHFIKYLTNLVWWIDMTKGMYNPSALSRFHVEKVLSIIDGSSLQRLEFTMFETKFPSLFSALLHCEKSDSDFSSFIHRAPLEFYESQASEDPVIRAGVGGRARTASRGVRRLGERRQSRGNFPGLHSATFNRGRHRSLQNDRP